MNGSLSVLNCAAGDIRVSFKKNDPQEVARAKRIIQDMLARGYLLFVEQPEGLIPLKTPDKEYLIIVLKKANLDRMKAADPAEIDLRKTGLTAPLVMICYEEDEAALNRFVQAADIHGLMKHLSRGWKFRPEKGDHDRGPERVNDQN